MPFALFLLAWLLAFGGALAFFALYPVLMRQCYGITPWLAANCCGPQQRNAAYPSQTPA
jgi:hypothetical protein